MKEKKNLPEEDFRHVDADCRVFSSPADALPFPLSVLTETQAASFFRNPAVKCIMGFIVTT